MAAKSKGRFEEHAQVVAAESRLDGWVPPFFGAASGVPCAGRPDGEPLCLNLNKLTKESW
jgi:hypothetical protein